MAERFDTHVIVLAAGRGSRLGPRGDEIPKWLLRVGHRTIAERQVEGASEATTMSVVIGHADSEIARFLEDHGHPEVETVFNPEWSTLNNWYSLLVGLR